MHFPFNNELKSEIAVANVCPRSGTGIRAWGTCAAIEGRLCHPSGTGQELAFRSDAGTGEQRRGVSPGRESVSPDPVFLSNRKSQKSARGGVIAKVKRVFQSEVHDAVVVEVQLECGMRCDLPV